jgi:hypothetical protein
MVRCYDSFIEIGKGYNLFGDTELPVSVAPFVILGVLLVAIALLIKVLFVGYQNRFLNFTKTADY